jgi:glycosyltransferase involved in cell wall biosynthesis
VSGASLAASAEDLRPPSQRSLEVALLSPCSWPEVRRGAERMFRDLAAGMEARGHRPWLITSHPGAPSRSVEDGVRVTRNWRPPSGRLLRRGYEEHLTHLPASYLSLTRGSADVAHASHAPDATVAARWSRSTGRPAVFSFMGIPDRRWLVARRLRLDCMLRAIDGCAATVALSRAAADEFRRALGVEARVIHPGVDLRAFTPGPRGEVPSILCTASLEVPEKRVGLLIDALPIVRRARPGTRLVLQRPVEVALARQLASVEGVELIDPDPALLVDAYRGAWATALPSRSDAFGLVLAESLACGTPVFGSDLGGIPEIIDRPEIGRTFAGADPQSIADAALQTLELATDPACVSACRRRAETLSVERCVDAYEALYRELLC